MNQEDLKAIVDLGVVVGRLKEQIDQRERQIKERDCVIEIKDRRIKELECGEYICRKCGLRKNSEPCDTGGHF